MNYKSMYKSELARAAGVTSDTFRRWLQSDRAALQSMGVRDSNRLLPPVAVKYICDKYCIHIQDNTNAILPLPAIALYSNLYYHGLWFRAMEAQFGVNVRYHTAYYAPLLCPATSQFCTQSETKVGNYPVINVYANFYVRLIRLRFFAEYQHLNGHFMDAKYFSMPGYPLNPPVFRAGLAWHFYK